MHDPLQPSCPSREGSGDRWFQALREHAPGTVGLAPAKTANPDLHLDSTSAGGQVRQAASITTVDAARHVAAARAERRLRSWVGKDGDALRGRLQPLDNKPAGANEIPRAIQLNPSDVLAPGWLPIAPRLSQSQLWTPVTPLRGSVFNPYLQSARVEAGRSSNAWCRPPDCCDVQLYQP